MSLEPKLITVPGIPGQLQEQTLDQFVSVLSPDHLVRRQLDEIRNQALKSVELSTQLMQANDKILELQNKLMSLPQNIAAYPTEGAVEVYPPVGSLPIDNGVMELVNRQRPILSEPQPKPDPRSGPFPKVECPHCKKMVSAAPGPWAKHQQGAHPDNQAPRPV